MIEKINSSKDIKGLSDGELGILAEEIRKKIIETVSRNGGHLASNLGIVETVIAIHKVFDTPKDAVVFDVGHQCYAHKLLTGRYESFDTLRLDEGISGFVSPGESEYDTFTEGHSGTSLSQALGVATASKITGDERYVVAVVGDGSFTNGMIFEALNNCIAGGRKLIIILNDNEMSISKNVGGLSNHLTNIRTSKKYFAIKHRIKRDLAKTPRIGRFFIRLRDFIRRVLVSDNLFECMGIDYIGSVDGNDISKLQTVLEEAKTKDVCTLVHIHTKKGKGYLPAERNPEKYHSVGPFDVEFGAVEPTKKSFSSVFGEVLRALAEKNDKICAVTAAMEEGCGLIPFKQEFPKRFFDVGIAEEHAVTFSAGLSRGGLIPVCTMYSTFSQRVYDQLHHDAAIQKLPFVLCLDRCGIVEGDGITHQGIFDVSEFSGIPGVNIYSPDSYGELEEILGKTTADGKFNIVRYPKGAEEDYDRSAFEDCGDHLTASLGGDKAEVAFVTYGRITKNVFTAAVNLSKGAGCAVKIIKLKKIFPLNSEAIVKEIGGAKYLYIAEEGIKSGGIGEKIAALAAEGGLRARVKIHAVNGFVPHGTIDRLFEKLGLDSETMEKEARELVLSERVHGGAEV